IKIGITFFGSKLDLLCISKVLTIFCVFSRIRRKRKHSRGHVACSPGARGDLSVGALGRAAHSEEYPGGALGWGTRDTWRTRRLPGEVSLAGLAAHSEASGRLVAHSESSG